MAKKKTAPTEVKCDACNGTGFPPVSQPARPGRRVYPPSCKVCGGKERLSNPAAKQKEPRTDQIVCFPTHRQWAGLIRNRDGRATKRRSVGPEMGPEHDIPPFAPTISAHVSAPQACSKMVSPDRYKMSRRRYN